jgi:formylglycine-generating enzyme required for sulfatase activity
MSFHNTAGQVVARRCAGCHGNRDYKRPDGNGLFRLDGQSLRSRVRVYGNESDVALYPPGEWYADASELMQMLRKGHHGVRLDANDSAYLRAYIDLNTPGSGWSWSGHRVRHDQCARRDRLRDAYMCGAPEPGRQYKQPHPGAKPIVPDANADSPDPPVTCTNWPFDAAAARRRQKAAAPAVTRTIELGKGPDGNSIALELVRIPAGEFVMGDHAGLRDERPATRVRIAKPFWMGSVEVSNEMYALFDPDHDSYRFNAHPTSGNRGRDMTGIPLFEATQPVVRVSWARARAFCRWLSAKTGMRFRLPTEAEWEWACRAGSDTPFWYGGMDANFAAFANMADLSFAPGKRGRELVARVGAALARRGKGIPGGVRPHDKRFFDLALVSTDVTRYAANPWGLRNMHGNVGEWTRSAYRPYPYDPDDGRHSNDTREDKAIRGGSWFDRPHRCTSAFRNYRPAWMGSFDVGFRVVAEADDFRRQAHTQASEERHGGPGSGR